MLSATIGVKSHWRINDPATTESIADYIGHCKYGDNTLTVQAARDYTYEQCIKETKAVSELSKGKISLTMADISGIALHGINGFVAAVGFIEKLTRPGAPNA